MPDLLRALSGGTFLIASALIISMVAAGCISSDQVRQNRAGSASVLEDIESTIALEEQVARIAGVYLNEYGDLRIRGAQGPPLIVVDGSRLGNRGKLSFVSPEDVRRIEVVKGPQTASYGIGGGDGVILIATKRGDD